MSNRIFPDLPGITIDIQRQPEWNTVIKEAWSGVETRVGQRPWPRWRYTLKVDVLRATDDEINALEAFFNAHYGALESFLFRDPERYSVSNQAFGVCDGSATLFQLARPIADWVEPVWAPAASPAPVIKRNGSPLTIGNDYTLGTTGQVQTNTAFASGVLSWSGEYYHRVRFAEDKLGMQRILQGLWKSGKVEFISEVFPT